MKKRKSTKHKISKKNRDYLKTVCWLVVPFIVLTLLILDALGIYVFTSQRLTVLGVGVLIILLPFFSEISLKNISVKRNPTNSST